ncbi:MAG: signal peptidase I [Opitutae bacterium]|nr:signal peptidase I [Opitutae bacterium]
MTEPKISRRKLRKIAKEVLRIGQKIFFHKRDLMTPEDVEDWEQAMAELHADFRDKNCPEEQLTERIEAVDELAARHGDFFYHKKSWTENVEMFLVAAIVVIGVRSFFLQPFIIPTNSMYPSYYGMKPHIYEDGATLPGFTKRVASKILLGADHYSFKAKAKGHLYLKLPGQSGASGSINQKYYTVERSYFPEGKFFVFPTNVRQYTFSIGGLDHVLRVPAEFDLEDVIVEKFEAVSNDKQDALHAGMFKLREKPYEANEDVLAFDVLLGDALFVDRFTYNFRQPRVGDPIVFQTGEIDEYNKELREKGLTPDNLGWRAIGEDKYYIKRLVGVPGDTLQIQTNKQTGTIFGVNEGTPGKLMLNGKPIEGCEAFGENRKAADYLNQNPNDGRAPSGYPSYRASGLLDNQAKLKIPPNSLFAMGDNSPDSLDGRAWGFVPKKKVVGRAFFVYYPFTSRWGVSD